MYRDNNLMQALEIINQLILTLNNTQIDTFFDQISEACIHIAYASQAYIMIHLGFDTDVQKVIKYILFFEQILYTCSFILFIQILTNIKPKSEFNKLEKAAIYGIKSLVFLEYSPEGNSHGLRFAEHARKLNCVEIEWLNIWLKAKRRKRRSDKKLSFPSKEELEAAKELCTANTNLECLTSAASLYADAAFALSLIRSRFNLNESKIYNKLAADLIM